MADVSQLRLNVLRAYYLLIVLERGYRLIARLAGGGEPLGPWDGTAYAFWGGLALLALLGLRYPLQMLPLLLLHLAYKTIWLLIVALPLCLAGAAFDATTTAFTWAMAVGVLLDLLIIPWGYVIANYVRHPGEPWRAPAARGGPPVP